MASIGLFLGGCGTTNPVTPPPVGTTTTSDPVAAYLPIIQTATTVATGAVLQFAESDSAKRVTLANQIYASAKALDALTTGNIPTVAVLTATLNAYNVDSSITQYASYVEAISSIYSTYFAKISGNGTYAAEVINAIAKGAYSGAGIYATVTATSTTSN